MSNENNSKASNFTVCYFGTYRQNYARNALLIEGLKRNQIKVIECHETLWQGTKDRVQTASGGWKNPSFWLRVFTTYTKLIYRYFKCGKHDIVIVGYPGHFDVFLARILSWLNNKPLAWDVLNSLFLVSKERRIDSKSPFTVFLIKHLEKIACNLPDMLFLDTKRFVQWFCETHHLSPDNFRILPIGADDRYFHPVDSTRELSDSFYVIYYGSYIPNHGIDTIIKAAAILDKMDPSIKFTMIGDGPEKPNAKSMANKFKLGNLSFINWLPREKLIGYIGNSSLVLGNFGDTIQASLTNNNKIYEALAMRKPVISGNAPSLPGALKHKENIYLIQRNDPEALAQGIIELKENPPLREKLVEKGEKTFYEYFSIKKIGAIYKAHLQELLARKSI